jgi:hypothetical protein
VALDHSSGQSSAAAPPPVSGTRWESAVVGVLGTGRHGQTACGSNVTEETLGVAHPVLPCGVALVLSFRGHEVRTEVIDRPPAGAQTQFEVTRALADELGMSGTERIRWRFAG